MTPSYQEIAAIIGRVRARWRMVQALQGVARAAAATAVVLLLALVAWKLAGSGNRALLIIAALTLPLIAVALVWGWLRVRRRASERQIARLIEEQHPELEDRLASAVEFGDERAGTTANPLVAFLIADAARRAQAIDPAHVVSYKTIRRAGGWSMAAAVLLVAAVVAVKAPAERAYDLTRFTLFPDHLRLQVTPGDVRVRAGEPLKIAVSMDARHGGLTPTLEYGAGDRWQRVTMKAQKEGGTFAYSFPSVTSGFKYRVAAGPSASEQYAVTVLQLPHVARIDLRYEFPKGIGLAPRSEPDAGDIYAPPGTHVRLHVTTDKPIASGALTLDNGQKLTLTPSGPTGLDGELEVQQDGSYRVALNDRDGLKNPGDTEYFIRMLAHRPPEVRIVRPASDRQVTPLEEVSIDAYADAEYGIGQFDLVYSVRGGPNKVVPFTKARASEGGVNGRRSIYLEDLHVQPGDLISYYAQAHDATRSGKSGSARSDIFFLEVQPFEEQFTAAQSQAQGMSGGGDRSIEELAAAQKDIVVATWKLDRRSQAAGRQSSQDIKSVAKAQTALRTRVQEQMGQFNAAAMRDPRQPPRPGAGPEEGLDAANSAMAKAAQAMGKAAGSLDALQTSNALPHEMEALNQLLKAQAQVKERQVTQQASGGGRGDYRRNLDLSSLFDQELQRLQQTNYETPQTSTSDKEASTDQALDKVRDLARRQDELARQQEELAKRRSQMTPEELKRQLEKLTRDQSELRRQAEDLERELARQAQRQQQASSSGDQRQQPGQQGQQGQSQSGGQSAGQQAGNSQQAGGNQNEQMSAASKAMSDAAGALRKQNPSEASAKAASAADALRDLARRLEAGGPGADEMWRALGDMRLEANQLADAERQVASELRKLGQQGKGQSGKQATDGNQTADALRRIGGEKQRLADRAQRVEEGIRKLLDAAKQGKGDQARTKALAAAADELARQQLSTKMRQSAEALQKSAGGTSGEQTKDLAGRADAEQRMAQALDRVSDALAQAGSNESADARKLADQLSKVQDLRRQLDRVQRQMDALARGQQNAGAPSPGSRPGDPQQGRQAAGQNGRQAAGQNGDQAGDQTGSRMADLERARDELLKTLQRTRDMLGQSSDANGDDLGLGFTPEGQAMSLSAPGTQAFKQDFARWQSLQRNANAALERLETSLSQKLQQQLSKDRLAAGGDDRAPAAYQSLVDSYFKALAQKKPPQP